MYCLSVVWDFMYILRPIDPWWFLFWIFLLYFSLKNFSKYYIPTITVSGTIWEFMPFSVSSMKLGALILSGYMFAIVSSLWTFHLLIWVVCFCRFLILVLSLLYSYMDSYAHQSMASICLAICFLSFYTEFIWYLC